MIAKSTNKSNKRIIYCVIALAVVVLIFGVVQIVNFFNLSTNEKRAIRCVEDLQSRLKVDDSLVLKSDILVFMCDTSNYKEHEPYTFFVIFDYSAQNSFGVQVNDTAIYNGSTYFASANDDANDFERYEDKQDFLTAMIALGLWNIYGEDIESDRVLTIDPVNGRFIARHVGCKFTS